MSAYTRGVGPARSWCRKESAVSELEKRRAGSDQPCGERTIGGTAAPEDALFVRLNLAWSSYPGTSVRRALSSGSTRSLTIARSLASTTVKR